MYDPPFCAVCGGPFDHVELLDFAGLGDEDEYLKNCAYDSNILSPDNAAWIGHFRILAPSSTRGCSSGVSVSPEADVFVSVQGQWNYDEDWYDEVHNWISPTTEEAFNSTPTSYQDFFIVHNHCMNILQKFFDYAARSPSPHSPKLVQELITAWHLRQKDDHDLGRVSTAHGGPRSLPSDWAFRPCVEHSHLYFGARRFWTDPWDCVPGHEHLCADPIQESDSNAFLSACLTRPYPSNNSLVSPSGEQMKPSEDLATNDNDLVHLPREIHDLVISYLSLKHALSFCSTNQKLLGICDGTFWRLQTMRLHDCWFWELQGPQYRSPDEDWKGLLQLLTTSRSHIQEGAKPFWHSKFAGKDAETGRKSAENTELSKVPLPVGLRNRQRIWMCLESLGTKAEWEVMALQWKKSKGHGN